MKFIKISLYVLGGFVLLAIVAAGIFVATFDANDYKPQISEQVKQQTGRDFKLADIKPAVFPWVGIELQELTLANAKGFKEEQMLQIERLDVRVAILPLLAGEVKIDTLRIHGLKLTLAKDKQGVTNWDDILQKQQTDKTEIDKGALKDPSKDTLINPETDITDDEEKHEDRGALQSLMVNGIDISDASIHWFDAMTKQKISLQKFNLNTGEIKLGQLIPVKLQSQIKLSEPEADFGVEMNAQINYDAAAQTLKLESLDVNIDAVMKKMGIDQAFVTLSTKLDANLAVQQFKVTELTLDINASGEAIPGGKITAKIKSAVDMNLNKQTAHIKPLSIEVLGLNMESEISVANLLDSPNAQGQFKLKDFNPAELLKKLAIEIPVMQNKKSLQSSRVFFKFTGTEKTFVMKELKIKLDETQVSGGLTVSQFEKPVITYDLLLDQIKLDNYLPPVPPEEKENKTDKDKSENTASETDSSKDVPIDLPVALLRDLNVKGKFKAKTIQAVEQTIDQLYIEAEAKGGLIKLHKVSANLLDGSVVMSAQLDVRKNTPLYQMALNGKGLEADSVASPVLQDVLGEKDVRLTGESNLDLNIRSKGQSVKQLMANSNGQLKFNMGKAVLHEVDIEFYVRQAVTAYMDEKKIPVKDRLRGAYKPKQTTAIKVVRATANITNGLVDNKDLLVDSTRFKVTGAGKINLATENINYRAVVDVNPASVKTTGEKIVDVPMPVNIKGGFSAPEIKIDYKTWWKGINKVLKSEFKKSVTDKTDKKIEATKDKVKDKLKDKLKGLFR